MKIIKQIVAGFVGLVAGGGCVGLIESFGHRLNPPPADLDFNNRAQLETWIQTLPTSAFAMVVIAWAVGALLGPMVARLLSPRRGAFPAILVWGLLGLATVMNLISIPHPWWMWPAGMGVWLIFGLLGLALSAPRSIETTCVRLIAAPVDRVFQTVALPDRFCAAIPDIVKIEIVSEIQSGIGTRFRETRLMNGKPTVAEMQVTEFHENKTVRLVADMAGTNWDTRFDLQPQGNATELKMQLVATPQNLLSRLATPMMIGMIGKAISGDMDHVKAYCEKVT
ncbi:MAG: SRPBCC family protein [Planctomycetaceae bacterium]|nr:SRPBCC family protein [Planctomycetaceae bacterium]